MFIKSKMLNTRLKLICISATVQIRICDTGKKQLEVSDPEVGKEAQYHLRQFIKYMKQLGRYY